MTSGLVYFVPENIDLQAETSEVTLYRSISSVGKPSVITFYFISLMSVLT